MQVLSALQRAVDIRCHSMDFPAPAHSSAHSSVSGHKIADAPVLVLFSGGVDSTLLAALAHRSLPESVPIDLASICFDGGQSPDRWTQPHQCCQEEELHAFLIRSRALPIARGCRALCVSLAAASRALVCTGHISLEFQSTLSSSGCCRIVASHCSVAHDSPSVQAVGHRCFGRAQEVCSRQAVALDSGGRQPE